MPHDAGGHGVARGGRLSRRTFLKASALTSSALAIGGLDILRGRTTSAWADPLPGGFTTTGLGGGGGVNCVAADAMGRLVAGGDISGPKLALDGRAWQAVMGGLPANGPAFSVCALEWDPAVPDRIWMATQRGGTTGGGVFVSSDAAGRWALATNAPVVDPGSSRPRLVGQLLAVSPDGGAMYIGGTDGGIWRYDGFAADGTGGHSTQVAALGEAVASIALDPTDPTRLFVATRTRCWRVGAVDTAGRLGSDARPFTGAGAPGRTEEIAVVSPTGIPVLYAACWLDGLRRFDASQALDGTWDTITPAGGSTQWCSIDAAIDAGATVVVAGNAAPASDPSGGFDPITGASFFSVFLTEDGDAPAPVWTSVCSGSPGEGVLANEDGGAGGDPWWGYLPTSSGGSSDNRLGNRRFVPEQIRIDASDVGLVHVVGTQGAFRFERATSTWYPSMMALGVTSNNTVHCDPTAAGRVLVTNTDHVCFVSTDAMVTARKNENPDAALPNNGFAAAFDTGASPSSVYLAVGEDGNRKGAVFFKGDPADFGSWVSLGRPAGTDQRPLGIAVRRLGTQVVVLAAVQGKGLYRRRFDTSSPPHALTTWARVNGTAMTATQKTTAAPMRWRNDAVAYLFDHASGIWRSIDAGVTWQRIWVVKNNVAFQGYLDTNPDDATGGTLYVSMGAGGTQPGLWRLTGCQVKNATVENGGVPRSPLLRPDALPFSSPGPIVTRSGGSLWVIENAQQPDLYRSDDGGTSWVGLGDTLYHNGAKKISDMDVAADGSAFLALKGPGVLRYVPPVL